MPDPAPYSPLRRAAAVTAGAYALYQLATYLRTLSDPVKPYGTLVRSTAPPAPGGKVVKLSHGECHYILEGNASDHRPLIVLAHGLVGSSSYLRFLARYLVSKGRRVLRPDFYGRGGSSSYRHLPNTVELFAGQLAELLFALRETKPIDLVGYSMGGGISAKFAATYPQCVNSLVLVAPVGMPAMKPLLYVARLLARVPRIDCVPLLDSKLFAVEAFAQEWQDVSTARWEEFRSSEVDRLKYELVPLRRAIFSAFKYFDFAGLEPEFRELERQRVKALVLWGEKDGRCPFEGAKQLRACFPTATLISYANSTHILPVEEAEVVGQAIEHFHSTL